MRNRSLTSLARCVLRPRDEGGCPLQLDVGRSAFSVGRLLEFYLHL